MPATRSPTTVPELGPFYYGACGFRPTEAGLIRLNDQGS
ncbi:hypothetical protein H4W30_003708 [Amycolatopsis roodepoortensis]|uniref:Uncharacterized protein n=1 Tax=Amycolatopsis roodepoortensis TaxID=700274 RepID=A0ABR9L7J3_9PSEU|nr:hypothetical protein [Amycolatopsis roodepoortensis]